MRILLPFAIVAVVLLVSAPGATALGDATAGLTPFTIKCANDEWLSSVQIRAGARINQFGIRCAKYGRLGGTLKKVGGDGGSLAILKLQWTESLTAMRRWTGKCTTSSVKVCALRFKRNWVTSPKPVNYYDSVLWWPTNGALGKTSGCTVKAKIFVVCWHTNKVTIEPPVNYEIYGFRGSAANELHNIEVLTRPTRKSRPKPPGA